MSNNRQSNKSPSPIRNHHQYLNNLPKISSPPASASSAAESAELAYVLVDHNSTNNLVNEVVNLIKRTNIRLIAFDFDCTIVTIHTGGQWLDSSEKLAEFVRPCFRDLIPALLKCPELNTCVVTYSPQEKLIRDVLRISMKDEQEVNSLVNKMVIKGNTKEFLSKYGYETCYTNGKQPHLEHCREYFLNYQLNLYKRECKYEIMNSNILLIDDDPTNIKIAIENGHFAFQVNNNMKLVELYNYLRDKLE